MSEHAGEREREADLRGRACRLGKPLSYAPDRSVRPILEGADENGRRPIRSSKKVRVRKLRAIKRQIVYCIMDRITRSSNERKQRREGREAMRNASTSKHARLVTSVS